MTIGFTDYAAHDAHGLMALLHRGEVSAQELHDTAVAAIDALNPALNAVVSRAPEAAVQALARAADYAPFAGLPFLVKDGVGLTGQRAILGCSLAKDIRCDADSNLVQRLKRSGVVILGSTNAPEMGLSPTCEGLLNGIARNPWNLERSTGGSSGGSAAAVAAGIVPVAQSSDGAGSIRTPDHCCGNFGLKPSRGRNPVGPLSNGGPLGMGAQHVSTRTVRDSAAFLDMLHGDELGALWRAPAPQRPFLQEVGADPGRLRVAFSADCPSGEPTDPAVIDAVIAAARLCEDLGHDVEEAAPTYEWELFAEVLMAQFVGHFSTSFAALESATGQKAGSDTLERATMVALEHSRSLSLERFLQSHAAAGLMAREFSAFFVDRDILITPVNITPALPIGVLDPNLPYRDMRDFFDRACAQLCPHTPIYNLSGLPAMSMPLGMSPDRLPIGVQFGARYGGEATLLRLAAQIEIAEPWTCRRPPNHIANFQTISAQFPLRSGSCK